MKVVKMGLSDMIRGIKQGAMMSWLEDFYYKEVGRKLPNPNYATDEDYDLLGVAATKLNMRSRHDDVLGLLQPYVNDNIKSTHFWNELGMAYCKVGRKKRNMSMLMEAYFAHMNAYVLNSSVPIYMFNLAVAAHWVGRKDEALNYYRKYIDTGDVQGKQFALEMISDLTI
jgi:hypothetical protein